MSQYAVVKIIQFDDYVENLECDKIFNSYEDAKNYIINIEKEYSKTYLEKENYIDNWLKNLKVPTSYEEVKNFQEKYNFPENLNYINLNEELFKNNFK